METNNEIIQLVISFAFAGALVFTIIITCLSLVGWIKFADKKQQSKLFHTLIIELVIIGLGYFSGVLNINPHETENYIVEKTIKEGVVFLNKRHLQTVTHLTDNWYDERIQRLKLIKEIEIDKITEVLPNSKNDNNIEVVRKDNLIRINNQYDVAIKTAKSIRDTLIKNYSDEENWKQIASLMNSNAEELRLETSKEINELIKLLENK